MEMPGNPETALRALAAHLLPRIKGPTTRNPVPVLTQLRADTGRTVAALVASLSEIYGTPVSVSGVLRLAVAELESRVERTKSPEQRRRLLTDLARAAR